MYLKTSFPILFIHLSENSFYLNVSQYEILQTCDAHLYTLLQAHSPDSLCCVDDGTSLTFPNLTLILNAFQQHKSSANMIACGTEDSADVSYKDEEELGRVQAQH